MSQTQFKITGTLIKNYFHCKRQAWLYSRGINFKNEITKLGNLLHQEKGSKEYIFDNIKVDDIDFKAKILIEHKKSSSNLEGSRMQVLFYLLVLKEKGLEFKGVIKDIEFGDEYSLNLIEEKERIETFIKELEQFLETITIPKPIKIQGCNKCSFYDYCWS